MLRFAPPSYQRLEQANHFTPSVGGAESNVAANLARLGKHAAWYSRLPDSPLGHLVSRSLHGHGVDVSTVTWAPGERLGLYFVEYGPPPRSIRVWYDRAASAASRMQASDLPLDVIRSARYLHLTGITPALSESCAATASAALAFAKEHDTRVSFDVNYRALLWSANTAAVTLEPFCETADIVLVALRDASKLFGESGSMSSVASSLQVRWGGTVVVTDGSNGAAGCDGKSRDSTAAFETEVVDRLGAGDAFASGLLCRLLEGASLADALRFAAATAALKLSIPGDIALVNRSEVDALLEQGSGTLSR